MVGKMWVVLAAAALVLGSAADAKVRVAKEFSFPKDQPVKIAVFRPDVLVGKMTTGGVEEPNAEWTAAARAKLAAELTKQQQALGHDVVFLDGAAEDANPVVTDYKSLFRAVTDAIATHGIIGGQLPSKKGSFDWTLGPGAAQIKDITGANYALFLFTHDSYGSAGRKAAQLLGAALLGVYIAPGIHVSYAALVDLTTGDIVWINVDPASGGDPREDVGATKRIRQILTKFPGSAALAAEAQ